MPIKDLVILAKATFLGELDNITMYSMILAKYYILQLQQIHCVVVISLISPLYR